MGLFGGKKKDLTYEGLPGKAVIKAEGRSDRSEHGDENTRLTDFGLGSFKFKFELEVTLDDGRPPYTVTGKFKVPAKFGGETGPGVTLPVYADPDDPSRVEINWDQFVATGGAQEFQEGHHRQQQAAVHNAMPEQQRSAMLNGWLNATNGGAMSRADFEKAVQDAVTAGMLTAEEAAEATSRLTV